MQCSNSFVEVIHIVTDACFLERVSSGMFWSVICDDGNRSRTNFDIFETLHNELEVSP